MDPGHTWDTRRPPGRRRRKEMYLRKCAMAQAVPCWTQVCLVLGLVIYSSIATCVEATAASASQATGMQALSQTKSRSGLWSIDRNIDSLWGQPIRGSVGSAPNDPLVQLHQATANLFRSPSSSFPLSPNQLGQQDTLQAVRQVQPQNNINPLSMLATTSSSSPQNRFLSNPTTSPFFPSAGLQLQPRSYVNFPLPPTSRRSASSGPMYSARVDREPQLAGITSLSSLSSDLGSKLDISERIKKRQEERKKRKDEEAELSFHKSLSSMTRDLVNDLESDEENYDEDTEFEEKVRRENEKHKKQIEKKQLAEVETEQKKEREEAYQEMRREIDSEFEKAKAEQERKEKKVARAYQREHERGPPKLGVEIPDSEKFHEGDGVDMQAKEALGEYHAHRRETSPDTNALTKALSSASPTPLSNAAADLKIDPISKPSSDAMIKTLSRLAEKESILEDAIQDDKEQLDELELPHTKRHHSPSVPEAVSVEAAAPVGETLGETLFEDAGRRGGLPISRWSVAAPRRPVERILRRESSFPPSLNIVRERDILDADGASYEEDPIERLARRRHRLGAALRPSTVATAVPSDTWGVPAMLAAQQYIGGPSSGLPISALRESGSGGPGAALGESGSGGPMHSRGLGGSAALIESGSGGPHAAQFATGMRGSRDLYSSHRRFDQLMAARDGLSQDIAEDTYLEKIKSGVGDLGLREQFIGSQPELLDDPAFDADLR